MYQLFLLTLSYNLISLQTLWLYYIHTNMWSCCFVAVFLLNITIKVNASWYAIFVCKTLAYKYIIKHARFCQKRWAKKHASTDLLNTQNMQHLHKDHWLPQPSKLHQFCPLMDRQSIFPSISQHKFIDIYTPKSNLYGYCFFSPWMQTISSRAWVVFDGSNAYC